MASEDLFDVVDKQFYEDVGRGDNEYSAYHAGFRAGVDYASRTPPPATAELRNQLDWVCLDYPTVEVFLDRESIKGFLAEWPPTTTPGAGPGGGG